MNREYRRFELLLPLKFNDGEPVPAEATGATVRELRERFGAVSAETQTIRGEWEHGGIVYRDELFRVCVDVPDTPENRAFFAAYKERLKSRFKQIDIWMTSHPIDVV
jgi:hypothetical protein